LRWRGSTSGGITPQYSFPTEGSLRSISFLAHYQNRRGIFIPQQLTQLDLTSAVVFDALLVLQSSPKRIQNSFINCDAKTIFPLALITLI
jgi:hypothetical protein